MSNDKKIILAEEDYVNSIEYLIRRDFFPNLPLPICNNENELTKLSLDDFLNNYTSEDNASFNEIMERWKKKNEKQLEYMYERNNVSNKLQLIKTKTLAITQQVDKSNLYKNSLMHIPSGIPSIDSIKENTDIKYINTRVSKEVIENQDKKRKLKETTTTVDLDNLPDDPKTALDKIQSKLYSLSSSSNDNVNNNTPLIQGYKLERTPIINPEEKSIMTWGTIESTPFRIPPTPKREELANKLAERASKSIRKRELLNNNSIRSNSLTPSPFSTPGSSSSVNNIQTKFQNLSSAAKQLALKHLRNKAMSSLSNNSNKTNSSNSNNILLPITTNSPSSLTETISKKKRKQEDK
ncbi:hypothetical protein ABK040_007121 [Willaertia magna]